jgi:two-component system, OmpR family, KDP operon response regulator KdpE
MANIERVPAVDDDPQTARVLRTVLSCQGYEVLTSPDGASALSSFTAWKPHLVLTEMYMPQLDGVVLCRRIRAVSRVPIIVVSVDAAEEAKAEALDSGADDYITKPFGIVELLARVRAALRRARDTGDEASDRFGQGRRPRSTLRDRVVTVPSFV